MNGRGTIMTAAERERQWQVWMPSRPPAVQALIQALPRGGVYHRRVLQHLNHDRRLASYLCGSYWIPGSWT